MRQLLKREVNLGSMINELGFNGVDCICHLQRTLTFHSRTSHIHLKYNFIRLMEGQDEDEENDSDGDALSNEDVSAQRSDKWKVKMKM